MLFYCAVLVWKGHYSDMLSASGEMKVGVICVDVESRCVQQAQMLCCFVSGQDIGQANAGSSALVGNSLDFSCCKSHSERVESAPGTAAIYLPGGGLLL